MRCQDVHIEQSIDMAGRILISANLRTQHFKSIFNLYHTPVKMLKWRGLDDRKCFRYSADSVDIVHIFYMCRKLTQLLGHIEKFLSGITGVEINITSSAMLMGTGDDRTEGHPAFEFRYLIFIAVAVARLCIASMWLQKETPTFEI